jgi:hypothetical protein
MKKIPTLKELLSREPLDTISPKEFESVSKKIQEEIMLKILNDISQE